MTQGIWLALACTFLTGFDVPDATIQEHARLEGVWSFALVEVEGAKQPDVPYDANRIIILRGGSYIVVQGPRITWGVIKLDASQTPKHFDSTVTNGPRKGRTTLAIYELEGDTCKFCASFRSQERPKSFATEPGSGLMLQVWKREKKDAREALVEVRRQELTGTWQAVSYSVDDNAASDDDVKKIMLMIDARGKITPQGDGRVVLAGSTEIDPNKDPMTMDVTFTEGEYKGQTALGIFKVEDDLLTICRATPDKARPTEFGSKQGSGHTLMTFKRETLTTK